VRAGAEYVRDGIEYAPGDAAENERGCGANERVCSRPKPVGL
jgi:hypothetical protein